MITGPEKYGKMAYYAILGVFVLGMAGWVGFQAISGKFWKSRAQIEAAAREQADANARQALENAANAAFGQRNSAQTRERMDNFVIDVKGLTDLAAQRIESKIPAAAPEEALDEDVIAEIEAAEARVRAQAKRLRGKK